MADSWKDRFIRLNDRQRIERGLDPHIKALHCLTFLEDHIHLGADQDDLVRAKDACEDATYNVVGKWAIEWADIAYWQYLEYHKSLEHPCLFRVTSLLSNFREWPLHKSTCIPPGAKIARHEPKE